MTNLLRPTMALLVLALLLATPASPALGKAKTWTLTVTNKTCSPISISVDGNFKEAIPASTYFTIKNLKTGVHVVTAQGCSGTGHRNVTVGEPAGNAYEEFQCAHLATADPYKLGGQPTDVPPAPVVVPYDPGTGKDEHRENRPLIRVYIPGRYTPSRHHHPDPWRRPRF